MTGSPQPRRTRPTRAASLASLLAKLDVHRRFAEQHSPLGTADARLLWLLSDDEPRTLRQIGEQLHLEQSTVNRQVNGAVAAGLVQRAEQARGVRRFVPTAAGSAAFESATSSALGACESALATLGDDAGSFLRHLETFIEGYGDAVAGPSPRRQ